MSEHEINREELVTSLSNQRAELQKFRDRITALRSGIQYCEQGNKIYYSVDFSEIYSFLHYGDPSVSDFGVSVTPTGAATAEKAKEQHYLALTHLFNSFPSGPLYLLQPYMLEMYSYARRQAHHSLKDDRALSDLLNDCAAKLMPRHRKLLQDIDSPDVLTETQKEKLLKEMASDYPTLSIELLEYDRWREENKKLKNRGQLLQRMLAKRKVTHRIDEMLASCGIRARSVAEPSVEEEKRVAQLFPSHPEDESRKFARLLDARAILFLRNLNRLLEPQKARLILISRDVKSPKIAERLEGEEWFGWQGVQNYFYGIETVYIDLILRHLENPEKLSWLENAEDSLNKMLDSLDHVLAEQDSGASDSASDVALSVNVPDLLETNANHWNQFTDLNFIRISPVIDWLGKDFVEDRVLAPAYEVEEEVKAVKKDQVELLRNLVTVVDSDEFQEVVSRDAEDLWTDITLELSSMAMVSEAQDQIPQALNRLKADVAPYYNDPALFKARVERSVSFSNMPTINFKTEAYRDFVKNFRPWVYERDQILDQAREKLGELFAQAAAQSNKAESWLFMAFVIGMLDHWDQSVDLALRGLNLLRRSDAREFEYFLAYAKCNTTNEDTSDPAEVARQCISAYEHVNRAIKWDYSDPRFLERQAIIAWRYYKARRQFNSTSASELAEIDELAQGMIGEQQIAGLLIQAERRAGKDRKLRIKALNNLAFTSVMNEPPRFKQAIEAVNKIQKEFDDALNRRDDSLPDPNKWPFVIDTIWYVRALEAASNGDEKTLDCAIESFQALLDKAVLLDHEREIIKAHLTEIKKLRQEAFGELN